MCALITLTTDFGYADHWVGVMKGVMLSINPELVIVDLTHQVPPHDIISGALALADSFLFFPQGAIHVAVVDPGVGSNRRPIMVKTEKCYFVGPDNGLLWPAIERLGGFEDAWQITNQSFMIKPISTTFHGRDIFAPVAAQLSLGTAATALGPAVHDLHKLILPRPVLKRGTIIGEVIKVDTFGNLMTNISIEHLRHLDPQKLTVSLNGVVIGGITQSYADVPAGNALALVGSSGRVEIAVFQGNAAAHFTASRGTPVEIRF